jgi:formate dehydrogenase beta subunit
MESGQAEKNSIDKFSTGFSEEQARAEANRCLRCGLVCYEKAKVIG